MVSDADIYGAAAVMLKCYPADAGFKAAQRADDFLERGELDAASTWRRIQQAVEELQQGPRTGKRWTDEADRGACRQECDGVDRNLCVQEQAAE
jgi:hypothetical protein